MPIIHLTTFIAAPPDRVFDLSRHVGIHRQSMSSYGETIVDGTREGMMGLNDTVTWQARHLFRNRRLQVRITQMLPTGYFADEQVTGDFRLMKHEHYFKPVENGTIMIDQMRFETPYGLLGHIVNRIFLEKYMTRLLKERNRLIREVAESSRWKQFLHA